jgi:hypothetical protein
MEKHLAAEKADWRCPKDKGVYSVKSNSHGPGWRKKRPPTDIQLGWRPTCSCYGPLPAADCPLPTADFPTVPATVLDPFVGSGTTCIVAAQLGRSAIGIEASPDYAKVARERVRVLGTRQTAPMPAAALPLFGRVLDNAPQPATMAGAADASQKGGSP